MLYHGFPVALLLQQEQVNEMRMVGRMNRLMLQEDPVNDQAVADETLNDGPGNWLTLRFQLEL